MRFLLDFRLVFNNAVPKCFVENIQKKKDLKRDLRCAQNFHDVILADSVVALMSLFDVRLTFKKAVPKRFGRKYSKKVQKATFLPLELVKIALSDSQNLV